MGIFHRCRWELVIKTKATAVHDSPLFKKNWEEPGIVSLWRCAKCGTEEARFISATNREQEINPDYIRFFLPEITNVNKAKADKS